MHVKSILAVATVLCGLSVAFDLEPRAKKGSKGSKGSSGGEEESSSASESATETATALGAEETCAGGWDCQNTLNNTKWCCGQAVSCGGADYTCMVGTYKDDGKCRSKTSPDTAEWRWACPDGWSCTDQMESNRDCLMSEDRRKGGTSALSSAAASLTSAVASATSSVAAAANTAGTSTRSSTTPTAASSDATRLVGSMAVVLGMALAGLAWL
ncbi:MAG: hypothetical protein M1823_001707 [Watsoniomyces obsoletus]|nr:MAG: hypothetical protein M1823_001707 [Watsoniomyces obsoletus]